MIGVHGTVNKSDESILFITHLQWRSKDLKTDLQTSLNINISIENNANLAAYAERVYQHHQSDNLLNILMASGIGAGDMIDGKIHKGYHGYADEMGHMIIVPDGVRCRCGNQGCWELYASEPQFFAHLKENLGTSSNISFDMLQQLIDKGDPMTCQLIDHFVKHISIGLNNVINIYNPETVVLNSGILQMYPDVVDKIKDNLISTANLYHEIVISELGNKSCVLGACALAIQRFLMYRS